ncbi:MAG TPA: hypothetical protein P5277_00740 [Candidatus Paceibacterota bacterium]|nr:hypothetical protein [Candidatus Paceibacterota bacterium]
MKIILTVKTDKKKSTAKEFNKTVDLIMILDELLHKNLKGYKSKGIALSDGTKVVYWKK